MKKPKFWFDVIAPNSFIIFRSDELEDLSKYLSGITYFKDNNIQGVILPRDVEIASFNDKELKRMGLKRIHDVKPSNAIEH